MPQHSACLNRGERLTELVETAAILSTCVEEQVAVIFAGVNGYLDDIDVNQVGPILKQGFLSLMRANGSEILDEIREEEKA